MSDLQFRCPDCNGKFAVPRNYRGRKVKCPKCKLYLRVPPRGVNQDPTIPLADESESQWKRYERQQRRKSRKEKPDRQNGKSLKKKEPSNANGTGDRRKKTSVGRENPTGHATTELPSDPHTIADPASRPAQCVMCQQVFLLPSSMAAQTVACPHCDHHYGPDDQRLLVPSTVHEPDVEMPNMPGAEPDSSDAVDNTHIENVVSQDDIPEMYAKPSEIQEVAEIVEEADFLNSFEESFADADFELVEAEDAASHPDRDALTANEFEAAVVGEIEQFNDADSLADSVATEKLESSDTPEPTSIVDLLPPEYLDQTIFDRKRHTVLIPTASGGFAEMPDDVTHIEYGDRKIELRHETTGSRTMRRIWRLMVYFACVVLLMLAVYLLLE